MAAKGRNTTSPKRIASEERHIKALELRKAGVNLSAIAAELGYSNESGAHAAIKAALDKARSEPARELREIMAARLDEMLVIAYENALQGDTDAMLAVLRIEERRARLFGIDRREAPVETNLSRLTRPDEGAAKYGTWR